MGREGEAPGEPCAVLPGTWRVEADMVARPHRLTTNAYLVVGEGESLMIDTAWWSDQSSRHVDALTALAESAGAPVAKIFLTHAHRDHSGFAEHVSASGAEPIPVLLHEDERATVAAMQNIQGLPDRAAAIEWYCNFGFPADRAARIVDTKLPDEQLNPLLCQWCADGELLEVGGRRLRVVATPGHTPGHAALLDLDEGLLFSGDAMLARGNGNPHVTVRPFTAPDPLTDYVQGLERLRSLDVQLCLPGHGPPVEDVSGLVSDQLDYAQTKMSALHEAMSTDGLTAYEIAGRLRWRGGRKSFAEIVNDEWFLAFGDCLARIRRAVTLGWAIQVRRPDGVPTFRKVDQ